MPRSPLISAATRELAQYFAATTDAAFIDRTWKINAVSSDETIRKQQAEGNPYEKITAFQKIYRAAIDYEVGTPEADVIANFLNGAVGIGDFQSKINWPLKGDYADQLRLYITFLDDAGKERVTPLPDNARFPSSTSTSPRATYLYAAEVYNPFLGPMTKDIGSLEIFMNAIPTLEFSRCVPYLNVELITLNRTAGTVAPPLTTLGFLNPDKLSEVDKAILGAQTATVRSEAGVIGGIGGGLRSGMELFTSPQTLVNMGAIGPEFVPTIDRLRPLASLGNLSLSTKIQGGTLLFMTGRLEITIHDRSRLREMAAFVRPDLYGTTFLDITYGWSHPDGGALSKNSYGKFLDALKNTVRFRIAGSSYSFEEGGQIKVTMNIQTVGTTDLLYIGPTLQSNALRDVQEVIRRVNSALAELRARPSAPSMAEFDFLSAFQDPASAMSATLSKDTLKKLRDLIPTLGTSNLGKALTELVGSDLTANAKAPNGVIGVLQQQLAQGYADVIKKIPSYDDDVFGESMLGIDGRFESMFDNTLYTNVGNETVALTDATGKKLSGVGVIPSGSNKLKLDKYLNGSDFISYGSAFMNLIAKPIAESKQYDEVQVIFYTFNKRAGAVHDLPISAFPMERARFLAAIQDLAKRTPNVSARQLIEMMYSRFTYFAPARPYLMAGFYEPSKAEEGTAEKLDPKAIYRIGGKPYAASPELTHEQRLRAVGIPEARFTLPRVQVAVEGSPLVDYNGEVVKNSDGNPKSIIKIHVFDEAMDPHSTITDLISAAKDNEVGVITVPVANYSADQRAFRLPGEVTTAAAKEAINAGVAAGVLTPISLDSLKPPSEVRNPDAFEAMKSENIYYQVNGSYDDIKRLVTSAVPTITYGTSTTAMLNASLSSNTSAGLGNVQLLRAFTEPGEVRAESLSAGVPMLVVPAQLGISTIGCPLFSPMQRLFIDFGTGTSIDNLYYVISFDSTIGKDGFKTDVKMKFGDGFASYRSLNQNLALLAANIEKVTPSGGSVGNVTLTTAGSSIVFPEIPLVDPLKLIDRTKAIIRNGVIEAAAPLAQIEAEQKARLIRELEEAEAKIMAKVEAEKAKAQAKLEAMVPEEVKRAAIQAEEDVRAAAAVVQEKAAPVIRAAILANDLASVIALAGTLPGPVGAALLSEVISAVDESREIAAENVG